MKVSKQDLINYHENGYLRLKNQLNPYIVSEIRKELKKEFAAKGKYSFVYETEGVVTAYTSAQLWQKNDYLKDFCLKSIIPQYCSLLMNSKKVNLYNDSSFIKLKNSKTATPWHNDMPYFPIEGSKILTCWIPLNDVDSLNSTLKFVVGSHQWGKLFQPKAFHKGGGLSYQINENNVPVPDIENNPELYHIETVPLSVGDIIFFSCYLLHGSTENSSHDDRIAYSIRYTGDDVTYKNKIGCNELLKNPSFTDGQILDSPDYPPFQFN